MRENSAGQLGLFSDATTCKFCSIVKTETESHIVFEDDLSLAFLDSRPLFPGHTLLVPKKHYSTLNDVPEKVINRLFNNTKILAIAVEKAMNANGSFIAINNKVSQSVPHLHIHIVPRKFKDGLKGFFWPRHKYKDDEEILETQKAIKDAIGVTG